MAQGQGQIINSYMKQAFALSMNREYQKINIKNKNNKKKVIGFISNFFV